MTSGVFAMEVGPIVPTTPANLKRMLTGAVGNTTVRSGANPFAIGAEGTETTVNTLTGAGCIKEIWFTSADPTLSWFARLKVYVDGQATADIDLELGTLFQTVGGTDLIREAETENWTGIYRYGGQTEGMLRLPIPFSNGCVVKISNPVGSGIATNTQFFVNAYNTSDVTSPLRLHAAQKDWGHVATMIYTDTFDFVSIAQGLGSAGMGYVVLHTLSQDSVNALTSLERNYRFYRDGEVSPSFETSGTEDFFLDSYYWGDAVPGGKTPPRNTPAASYVYRNTIVNDFDGLRIYAVRDLLNDLGGLRFTNGCTLRWWNDGQINGNNVNMRHTTFWYTGA